MTVTFGTGLDQRSARFRLSPLSVAVLAVSFLLGVIEGAVSYVQRSSAVEKHVAGTNAITIHLALAIAAAVVVISIRMRRLRRPVPQVNSPWAAPFSTRAFTRLHRTVRFSGGLSLRSLARVVVVVPLVLLVLYAPYRIGAQIIGGLDPNATVNAWGGPLGALLAHWLDCILGFYAAALLLSRVLIPADR